MILASSIATVVTLMSACGVSAEDFFFQFIGGSQIINNQRLRANNSIPALSLGVTEGPYNPSDHFSRLRIVNGVTTTLAIVPTNPHPPPIAGYYVLDGNEQVEGAERLAMSYRVASEGSKYRYTEWEVKEDKEGRKLLRYKEDEGYRWIAKQEKGKDGVKRWVPYWVSPTARNMGSQSNWEYDDVDLELVEAKGSVNSSAPGGVTEP